MRTLLSLASRYGDTFDTVMFPSLGSNVNCVLDVEARPRQISVYAASRPILDGLCEPPPGWESEGLVCGKRVGTGVQGAAGGAQGARIGPCTRPGGVL